MTVHGVSQSTWAERILKLDRGAAGLLFIINDRIGNVERERMVVPAEELLAAIMEPPRGGSTLECVSVAHNSRRLLDMEVRGNEVLLRVRGGATDCDLAVGLDDFQDALEKAIAAQ